MSDVYYIGNAATAVAQVTTVQITAYDVATSYKITVGGQVISVAGQGGTTTTTAVALAAAWNASTHPYCTAVTANANASNTITFTADVAGMPFVISSSVTGGTGTIGAATQVTASAGPFDLSSAANLSGGAIVANSDSFFCRDTSYPILFGLDQSAVTPTLVQIERTYTGQIGLPYNKFATSVTSAGVVTYNTTVPEYRTSYLKFGAATVRIGEDIGGGSSGRGSSLIKLDLGTTDSDISVYSTGRSGSGDSLPPLRIKNTNASSTLKIYAGSTVGVCWESPADTGQFSSITVFGGNVFVGDGVTVATLDCQAGNTLFKNAPTTVRCEKSATVTPSGSGTITNYEDRGTTNWAGLYTVTNMMG
jgi:hypothetical protein